MRLRTVLLSAVTLLALAAPAAAQNVSGFYIGGAAGAAWVGDVDGSYKPINAAASQGYKTGLALLGALGYGYGNGWRSELELSHAKVNAKSATFSTLGGGITGSTSGDASATGLFGNALYDFATLGLPVTPYLGLGLGWLRLDAKSGGNSNVGSINFVDDSDDLLGFQGIAGVALPIMQNLKMTLDYRYKSTFEKPKFGTTAALRGLVPTAQSFEADRPDIHAVMLGLRWEFGAPARPAPAAPMATPVAAPTPAPAAPAPAPAPAAAPAPQIQRNFLVFFDFNQSVLTPEAARIIQQAATTAKQGGVTRITATGHTDTSGSPQYNQRLSERRAAAVQAELVRQGIPANQIATVGRGESELRVRTADGVREPQNRRVEIVLQ